MSYAICRVQKIKGASSVHGVQGHQRRERDSLTNPDIDNSRKTLNYALIAESDKSFNTLADEIIKQGYTGKTAIRKDAVKVISALFTSDNYFFQDKPPYEQRKFFEDCYAWACEKFGKTNIFSAIVHMDEETPHLHIEFVPLTADGRLSAKAVLGGRVDLQRMQDSFWQRVGKPWGLERGERAALNSENDPNAKKPRKHLETVALKQKTAAEVKALESKKAQLNTECSIIYEHHATIDWELEDKRKKRNFEIKVHEERVKAVEEHIKAMTEEYNAKAEKYNQGIHRLRVQGQNLNEEIKLLKQEKAELQEERPYKNRCETLYEPFLQRHFGIDLLEDKKKWLYYAIVDKIRGTNEYQYLYGETEQVQQRTSIPKR